MSVSAKNIIIIRFDFKSHKQAYTNGKKSIQNELKKWIKYEINTHTEKKLISKIKLSN